MPKPFLTALLFGLGMSAPILIAADARESLIMDREKAFENAWDTRDATAMANLITNDYVMITRRGAIGDGKHFLDDFKNGNYADRDIEGQFPKQDLRIRFYGPSTAVVTFTRNRPFAADRANSKNGTPTLHLYTHIWVNTDGKGWRLASRHVSLPPTSVGR